MESGIIIVFESMAAISVIFAIVISLGKKYYGKNLKKSSTYPKK